jgi:RNA polymerase sigma factor (sigma-70 family)
MHPESGVRPDTIFVASERRRLLAAMIVLLPLRQGLVLHLRYMRGWRQREVAEVLHVKVPAICRVEQRALARFRSELEQLGITKMSDLL